MNRRETPEAVGAPIHSIVAGVSPVSRIVGFSPSGLDDAACRAGRRATATVARLLSATVLVIVMLANSGCELVETRESDPASPPAEPTPEADLATAMGYLEAGKADAARLVLAELAEEAPGSRVLASLMRQIDAPIAELLPGPYRQVEVGEGESLSLLAARELNDPLMFYALARLNDIAVPAQVPVGTMLKIPETSDTAVDTAQPPPDAVEAPAEITAQEVESVAQYLARDGQNDEARAMLISRLDESGGAGAESTRELLTVLTLEQANGMRAEGALVRALEVLEEAVEVMVASDQRAALTGKRQEIRAEMLHEEAIRLREQGALEEAYRAAQSAADLDTTSGEADLLVDDLRAELVDDLHNKALIAWRARNVDLAIRSWQSLLEVVPDFEPARVYLERARRLREKLDQP